MGAFLFFNLRRKICYAVYKSGIHIVLSAGSNAREFSAAGKFTKYLALCYQSVFYAWRDPKFVLVLLVYCIIKIPTIAEGNPQSCMRIFPIIADVFGISLRPQ